MERLLIIEDSVPFLNDLEGLLRDHFNILKATNAKKGLRILNETDVSAVLLDLNLPDINGMKVLKKIHNANPILPVIIVTEINEAETAVEAMKLGAYDYFPKAANIELLCLKIKQALDKKELTQKVKFLQETIDSGFDRFIFKSKVMTKVDYEITRLAKIDAPVLILGETGVGKDLVAYNIHKRSNRNMNPFVSVSIKGLKEELIESELFGYEKGAFTGAAERRIGKFEGANNGTIYLPEISSLNQSTQIKLLEFLQFGVIERVGSGGDSKIKLNVRLVLASNENLEALMDKGLIREDFYYRIKVITLNIPSLRERQEDIGLLAEYFLGKNSINMFGTKFKFANGTLEKLERNHWRGNVRELENSIINAITKAKDESLYPSDFRDFTEPVNSNEVSSESEESIKDFKSQEENFKKSYYKKLLKHTNGNVTKAATIAGISRQALHEIIKKLDIH